MFDTGLLQRLRYFSLLARRAGGRSLAAASGRRLPYGGSEVTGLRDYAPGDDYRHIDWMLCARRDELLTKVYGGNEDRYVYLLLDCSLSMGLGQPSKFDVARQAAAALGCAALEGMSCLSVAGFSDRLVAEQLPMRGKRCVPRLLGMLHRMRPQGTRTNLARTAESFVRRRQRHGPVVILGDLFDPDGFQHGLDVLQHRGYEPRIVQIYERGEAEPGLLGDVELFDVEAQTVRRVTVTECTLQRYREAFALFQRSVRQYCDKRGLACMQIATDTPADDVLLAVLGGKAPATTYAMEVETP